MGFLPILKPRQVCRFLEDAGLQLVRQRGSHRQYRHADGRCTTVPGHPGRDLSPILLRQILRDIGVTPSDFLKQVR